MAEILKEGWIVVEAEPGVMIPAPERADEIRGRFTVSSAEIEDFAKRLENLNISTRDGASVNLGTVIAALRGS